MHKGLKSKCKSASHQLLKESAKSRVNHLEEVFSNLQSARKESRANDIMIFEQQVNQMLRDWKSELNEPSPASSLVDDSLGSFTEELAQLLQQYEEEDDATSPLKELEPLKPQADLQNPQDLYVKEQSQEHAFQGIDPYESSFSSVQNNDNSGFAAHLNFHHFEVQPDLKQNTPVNNSDLSTQLDSHQLDVHQDFDYKLLTGTNDTKRFEQDAIPSTSNETKQCDQDAIPNILPKICPPPSAFLGPKCALWDCFRPAQGSSWCQDYCSSGHAVLALNEGLPGITPILRPGGISLKDGPLFTALNAKIQGKEVGIPKSEGAANTEAPWNAPDKACIVSSFSFSFGLITPKTPEVYKSCK